MKRNVSIPQYELYNKLKDVFPDAQLEYPIGGRKKKQGFRRRFADIGIPSLKIDFEYDGYSHKYTEIRDMNRDEELDAQGWKTIRINKSNMNLILNTGIKDSVLFLQFIREVVL